MCDPGRGGVREEHHHPRGPAGPVRGQRGAQAAAPALHPLQQAWIDVQVPHCGYCQNGMMIQAADLLATTKNPSEDQIKTAMNGHLCRCGTYPRILTAIQKAAAVMAKGGAWMTGFMHEKEFSRKSFIKGGGALIVGLAMARRRGWPRRRTRRSERAPADSQPRRSSDAGRHVARDHAGNKVIVTHGEHRVARGLRPAS